MLCFVSKTNVSEFNIIILTLEMRKLRSTEGHFDSPTLLRARYVPSTGYTTMPETGTFSAVVKPTAWEAATHEAHGHHITS